MPNEKTDEARMQALGICSGSRYADGRKTGIHDKLTSLKELQQYARLKNKE